MRTVDVPQKRESRERDPEIVHIVDREIDPDRALCGLDVSGHDWTEDGPECVVCAELDT